MKAQTIGLLFCLLPLFTFSWAEEPAENVEKLISFLQTTFEELSASSVDRGQLDTAINGDTKINSIYKTLVSKLSADIPTWTEWKVPSMGTETGALYVQDLSIFGVNNTFMGFDAPGLSYDIENLTLAIPYLHIVADRYMMNNFDLMGVVLLSGDGPMEIYLEDIHLEVKLKVKFKSLKFVVEHVPIFKISLGSAKTDFKNLGGSGESLAHLLNSVFTDVLPWMVQALNNDVQNVIDDPELYDPFEKQFCNLFSVVLNTLKDNIV